MFTHIIVHDTACVSPDHVTYTQIDYICIGNRFRRSLEDVRVKMRAGVASDRHPQITRMKLNLNNWMVTVTNRRKHKVGFLKDPQKGEECKLNLANKCKFYKSGMKKK